MIARFEILAAIALITSLGSQAKSEMDGRALLDICTNGDALQKGYCVGYLTGYRDGKNTDWQIGRGSMGSVDEKTEDEAHFSKSLDSGGCVFPRLPNHQMREIVVNYISEHPEIWHEDAGSLIEKSLWSAFPCETMM